MPLYIGAHPAELEKAKRIFYKDYRSQAQALYALGSAYLTGSGIGKNESEGVRCLEAAAKLREPAACFHLANCYDEGCHGLIINPAKAAEFLSIAACKRHVQAAEQLGKWHLSGTHVQKNLALAFAHLQTAALGGSVEAQYLLSKCFLEGKGTQRDADRRHYYLRLAALGGHEQATWEYGSYLRSNPDANEMSAAQWYCKLQDGGSVEAMYQLAKCFEDGSGGVGEDEEKAFELYKAAAEANHTEAMYKVGMKFMEEEEWDDGMGWLTQCADRYHPLAMYRVGMAYMEGEGVLEDEEEAFPWIERAATAGVPEAEYELGNCYLHGLGEPQDSSKAFEWFRKAANHGSIPAKYEVGRSLLQGRGVEEDAAAAAAILLEGAVQGHSGCMLLVGHCYARGKGVAINYAESLKWYSAAAQEGHDEAQFQLGVIYERGIGTSKDVPQAIEWYRKAAESNHAAALLALGRHFTDPSKPFSFNQQGFQYIQQAAEEGNAEAMFRLGLAYSAGIGTAKDLAAAFTNFEGAANHSHPWAQCNAGLCYYRGEGTIRNYQMAVKWFLQGAVTGHPGCQCNLAHCLLEGHGVDKDEEEAVSWLEKAAAADLDESALNINYLPPSTWVKPKDLNRAMQWYVDAARMGKAEALYQLFLCYGKGRGVARNQQQALLHLKAAASHGHEGAQLQLAAWYSRGAGEGSESAMEILKSLMESGNVIAKSRLGTLLVQGGTPEEVEQGTRLILEAAASDEPETWYACGRCHWSRNELALGTEFMLQAAGAGFPQAEYCAGKAFEEGIGTEPDRRQAFEWYSFAAKHGVWEGLFALGRCYAEGIGTEIDPQEAFRYWRIAGDQGYIPAMRSMAKCYLEGLGVAPKPEEGIAIYQRLVERDDPHSMCALAHCYVGGKGVAVNPGEAFRLWTNAAGLGDRESMVEIGKCHAKGLGTQYDARASVSWYAKAAALGSTSAALLAGQAYMRGVVVPRNGRKAHYHFKLGAEGGCVRCRYWYGRCLLEGFGCTPDKVAAIEHLRLAADAGNLEASAITAALSLERTDSASQVARCITTFHDAVAKGLSWMHGWLGNCYLGGRFVPQRLEVALQLYMAGISCDDVVSMTAGWVLHYFGHAKHPQTTAESWLRRAAASHYPPAMVLMLMMQDTRPSEEVHQDQLQSILPRLESSEPLNDIIHQEIGRLSGGPVYLRHLPPEQSSAALALGSMYATGCRVEKDTAKAIKLWQSAVFQGSNIAQMCLAVAAMESMEAEETGAVLDLKLTSLSETNDSWLSQSSFVPVLFWLRCCIQQGPVQPPGGVASTPAIMFQHPLTPWVLKTLLPLASWESAAKEGCFTALKLLQTIDPVLVPLRTSTGACDSPTVLPRAASGGGKCYRRACGSEPSSTAASPCCQEILQWLTSTFFAAVRGDVLPIQVERIFAAMIQRPWSLPPNEALIDRTLQWTSVTQRGGRSMPQDVNDESKADESRPVQWSLRDVVTTDPALQFLLEEFITVFDSDGEAMFPLPLSYIWYDHARQAKHSLRSQKLRRRLEALYTSPSGSKDMVVDPIVAELFGIHKPAAWKGTTSKAPPAYRRFIMFHPTSQLSTVHDLALKGPHSIPIPLRFFSSPMDCTVTTEADAKQYHYFVVAEVFLAPWHVAVDLSDNPLSLEQFLTAEETPRSDERSVGRHLTSAAEKTQETSTTTTTATTTSSSSSSSSSGNNRDVFDRSFKRRGSSIVDAAVPQRLAVVRQFSKDSHEFSVDLLNGAPLVIHGVICCHAHEVHGQDAEGLGDLPFLLPQRSDKDVPLPPVASIPALSAC